MPKYDFGGQAAIITGGAKGIGFAIAHRLLSEGAQVSLWDVDSDRLAEAAAKLGSAVNTQALDITNADAVDAAAAAVEREFGHIDILVNSAGITGPNKSIWQYNAAEWRQVIDINLTGTFLTCRAIAPYMRAKNYGRVVNIASIAGKEGNPNAAAYSASKAGVIGLTKSLGKELADTKVTANCVTPAAVKTEIFDQMTDEHINYMLSKIPLNRFGLVEEVANLVTWLASSDCSFSTGAVFDVSGGRATY